MVGGGWWVVGGGWWLVVVGCWLCWLLVVGCVAWFVLCFCAPVPALTNCVGVGCGVRVCARLRLGLRQVCHKKTSTTLHVWRLGATSGPGEVWDAYEPGSNSPTADMRNAEWAPRSPATSLLWEAEQPGGIGVRVVQVPGGRFWGRVAPFTWRLFHTQDEAEAAVGGPRGAGAGGAGSV